MKRLVSLLVLITFCFSNLSSSLVFAQTLNLPAPTQLLSLSPSYSFPVLRGLKLDPKNPLDIQFIIDPGTQKTVNKEEAGLLIKYFLAALTIPRENLWVNLSPYESNRIISGPLIQTELGEDMLGQDYLLKQLAASMTYPESETGKAYWKDLNSNQSFNKVWITADKAQIYEGKNVALITKSSLRALTEEDYLAMNKNNPDALSQAGGVNRVSTSSNAFKEHVLPAINNEINQGKNFAQLRQIYNAVILGLWFKNKFKDSFYKAYLNKETVNGIDTADKASKDKIYNLYVEAFKKGVYNYVKKERISQAAGQKIIKRQYFSGGVALPESLPPEGAAITTDPAVVSGISGQSVVVAAARMSPNATAPIPATGSPRGLRAEAEALAAQRNFVMPGGDSLRSSIRDASDELSGAATPQPPAVRSDAQETPRIKGRGIRANAKLSFYAWRLREAVPGSIAARKIVDILGQLNDPRVVTALCQEASARVAAAKGDSVEEMDKVNLSDIRLIVESYGRIKEFEKAVNTAVATKLVDCLERMVVHPEISPDLVAMAMADKYSPGPDTLPGGEEYLTDFFRNIDPARIIAILGPLLPSNFTYASDDDPVYYAIKEYMFNEKTQEYRSKEIYLRDLQAVWMQTQSAALTSPQLAAIRYVHTEMSAGWHALTAEEIARYDTAKARGAKDIDKIMINDREYQMRQVHRVYTGKLAVTNCTPDQIGEMYAYLEKDNLFTHEQAKGLMDLGFLGEKKENDPVAQVNELVSQILNFPARPSYKSIRAWTAVLNKPQLIADFAQACQKLADQQTDEATGFLQGLLTAMPETLPVLKEWEPGSGMHEFDGQLFEYREGEKRWDILSEKNPLIRCIEQALTHCNTRHVDTRQKAELREVLKKFQRMDYDFDNQSARGGTRQQAALRAILSNPGGKWAKGFLAGFSCGLPAKLWGQELVELDRMTEIRPDEVFEAGSKVWLDIDGGVNSSLRVYIAELLGKGVMVAEGDRAQKLSAMWQRRWGTALTREQFQAIEEEHGKSKGWRPVSVKEKARFRAANGRGIAEGDKIDDRTVYRVYTDELAVTQCTRPEIKAMAARLTRTGLFGPDAAQRIRWLMNWGFLGPKQDDNPDAATAPAVNEDKRGGVTWETAEIGKAVNSQNFYFENIPAVGEIRSMGFRVNGLYARTIGQVLETVK